MALSAQYSNKYSIARTQAKHSRVTSVNTIIQLIVTKNSYEKRQASAETFKRVSNIRTASCMKTSKYFAKSFSNSLHNKDDVCWSTNIEPNETVDLSAIFNQTIRELAIVNEITPW